MTDPTPGTDPVTDPTAAPATTDPAAGSPATDPAVLTNDPNVVTPSTVTGSDNEDYTTKKNTRIYVENGVTYAVDADGSTRTVEGDHFGDAVAIATLFDL